jgi:F-type H+-transporting ATPase subunit b
MTRALFLVLLLTAVGSAHADTMPQLDFANPLVKAQVVWGAVIFAVFYVLVSRWGLPRVGAILAMREQSIAGDLEQARLAKETADRAVAELNEARRVAFAESQAALAAAAQKAKDEAAASAAEVNARLDRQLAESEAQIDAARTAALGALGDVAADTATAVITRLTGRTADAARVRSAVAESLQARGLAHAG